MVHIFDESNTPYEAIETTHPGHATELAASATLAEYCGIVTVGGDGMLVEALNGLMSRPRAASRPTHSCTHAGSCTWVAIPAPPCLTRL